MRRDILSSGQDSFLLHVILKVFHEILLAEGMQHVIAGDNVFRQYARVFQPGINVKLAQVQTSCQIADTICDEINVVSIHDTIHLSYFLCEDTFIFSFYIIMRDFSVSSCIISARYIIA